MPNHVPPEELEQWVRREIPPSDWLEITQDRINRFADASNDHQFIHVDVEAASKTPFGGTIAHGFLTLSLVTHLIEPQVIAPAGAVMGINYGSDRLRFLNPVPVGARIRAKQSLRSVTRKSPTRVLLRNRVTVEIEGERTPAMLGDMLGMWILPGDEL